MATSKITGPVIDYNGDSNGAFFRTGALAGYRYNLWRNVSDVGDIPAGFRPIVLAAFAGPVRAGAGATAVIGEIRFATDGSITIPSGETQFFGTFIWPIK